MRHVTVSTTGTLLLAITLALSAPGLAKERQKTGLDAGAISQEIGKPGETKGDVYKISLPRADLAVSVAGVAVKPGLALGTWIAFKPAGDRIAAHGDLVLTDDEVGPVVAELERQEFQITGLHNHLINDSPHVMFLHFWGQGDSHTLARGLKTALALTRTPIGRPADTAGDESFPEAERILKTLGQKGDVQKGVLKVSVPRPETIKTKGTELPPSMGMATALNFQQAGAGQITATGDFVLTGEEVNRVSSSDGTWHYHHSSS